MLWFTFLVCAIVSVQVLVFYYHAGSLLAASGSDNDSRLLPRAADDAARRHISNEQLKLPSFKSKFFQQIHGQQPQQQQQPKHDSSALYAANDNDNNNSNDDSLRRRPPPPVANATSTSATTTTVLDCDDPLTPRLLQENKNVWEFNETADGLLPPELRKDCQVFSVPQQTIRHSPHLSFVLSLFRIALRRIERRIRRRNDAIGGLYEAKVVVRSSRW